MFLSDLIPQCDKAVAATPITGVTCDSRAVQAGDLFVAIRGTHVDGHDFIADAIKAGAAAVLIDADASPVKAKIPVLQAANTRESLAHIAARLNPGQPTVVAAVTGTNGKTSTAEFIRLIWQRQGWRAASIGTLGIRGDTPPGMRVSGLTTPDALDLHQVLDELAGHGVTAVAMEASSHGLEQHRLDGIRVHVAGFTHLSRDHLDHHPDMEAYFLAKARLFTTLLRDGGVAVIGIDCPYGRRLVEMISPRDIHVITVGHAEDADIRITAVNSAGECMTVSVSAYGRNYALPLALNGSFQADNAILAAAMVHAGGVELDFALLSLPYLRSAPGRMDAIHGHPRGGIAVIDYAHTPDALATALKSLRPETSGQLGVVFGCGGDRDKGKRAEMGKVAADLADFTIVTDDNPRSEDPAVIRKAITTACPEASDIGDRKAAIAEGLSRLGKGDVLLIAGKGHESQQMIGSETLPFSDEATVRGLIATMGGRA
ncbi:MAG: UDP-N-acetylmuramoyl-L-alanyl-D-glutamate--2,6-diaminopimelate ligase [Candidatus Puniceispirillales bacterium]